jgi:hypothetical protein
MPERDLLQENDAPSKPRFLDATLGKPLALTAIANMRR